MQPHFLQTPDWEKLEQLEGKTTFRLQTDDFEALATLETTPLGNYLFCPYGPTLKHPTTENLQLALNSLSKLARENDAFFVRIEPTTAFSPDELKSLHLIKSHDIDPAHTWVLDLSPTRDELLHAMRTSNRQCWNSHQKKGLKIRTAKDPEEIKVLTSLLAGVGQKNHFNPQSESHLQHQMQAGFATLYILELEDKPIAASLVYDTPTTRYYAHAATDNSLEYRKFSGAAVLLVQMIIDAKNQGQNFFDFWGITTSDNPKHPWYGFTKFKQSFGGLAVNYAGTWDLPLYKFRYRLYQLIRKINRLKRKIWK